MHHHFWFGGTSVGWQMCLTWIPTAYQEKSSVCWLSKMWFLELSKIMVSWTLQLCLINTACHSWLARYWDLRLSKTKAFRWMCILWHKRAGQFIALCPASLQTEARNISAARSWKHPLARHLEFPSTCRGIPHASIWKG